MTDKTLFISRAGAMRRALIAVRQGRCARVTIKPSRRYAHTRHSDFGFEVAMYAKDGRFVGVL